MKNMIKKITDRIFIKDAFGNPLFIKRILVSVLGIFSFGRLAISNHTKIEGTEYLKGLPNRNVLFLSNHQTYFADVMAFYHIFCSVKWGFKNTIANPIYLLAPRARVYYVAAAETMEAGLLPKIFKLAGAVTVNRSWRSKGQNVKGQLDTSAGDKIKTALDDGWLVSFPQGTTSPYAPIRKGTAHIIKENNPIVIPVVIDGFRRAFDKKGLFFKKKHTELSVRFKAPIQIDENASVEDITEIIKNAIEQEKPQGEWVEIADKEKEKKKKNNEGSASNDQTTSVA
ncbi:lysophospholipid acyltransferase family protein [Sediminitomix flava]|uniref:Acyltransferase-like protein n=1 Tax=Sediminitomix flava TaxID=379075 RepID=A0A315ZWJ9_SEDFL|nr:lysophospholipid acyltransferase family protein [Sediminitomix flava]PWJ41063.1 acyltransferase-like protein [Sediminitomix flava]